MKIAYPLAFGAVLSSLLLTLAACSSKPPAPEWQGNAFGSLQSFSSAYLSGNTRVADVEFARARDAVASTGRADLVARAELTRCATRAASLEFDNCAGFQPLAPDADAGERAYANYLNGQWQGLDASLLPPQHRTVVGSGRMDSVEDPLARLVAAAALLQSGRLTPADITNAVDTASAQGWRRPLLAWLGVQLQRAQAAADHEAQARIQRRIDLVAKP
ncbi:hypothetical protein CFter6_2428 [Collimonas fungivorans]|uniref:Lipoprotein n=1 Tax=Collimonas fungivorans TaxID=158899 RepID=A0A127PBA3_9BURK|nr:hypothetical protein [Collimonas fungivorans]AMO95100.1 hypothetical protein CFter6_2428 [Collimonas fungivorans]